MEKLEQTTKHEVESEIETNDIVRYEDGYSYCGR